MKTLQLSSDVILRKEGKGCLICQTTSGQYYQYNADAFEILKHLEYPITIERLLHILNKNFAIGLEDLTNFLEPFKQVGVVSDKTNRQARVHFQDQTEFMDNCLAGPTLTTCYVTEWCPKRCLHCIVESSPEILTAGELTAKQWIEVVLPKLKEAGVCETIFTGGDPLVKEGIFDILQAANDMNFMVTLLTDFDGMKQKHTKFLESLKHLRYVQTSLDGGTAKTHDNMRGNGSFNKTMKRLQLLKDSGLTFYISSTISKDNYHEIDLLADIALKYEAASLHINPLAPYGRAKYTISDLVLSDAQLWNLAQKYLSIIKNKGIKVRNVFWEENLDKIADSKFHPFKEVPDAFSLAVFNFSVNSKGLCFLDSKYKSENKMCLGHIKEESVLDMWKQPCLQEIREKYANNQFSYSAF